MFSLVVIITIVIVSALCIVLEHIADSAQTKASGVEPSSLLDDYPLPPYEQVEPDNQTGDTPQPYGDDNKDMYALLVAVDGEPVKQTYLCKSLGWGNRRAKAALAHLETNKWIRLDRRTVHGTIYVVVR